MGQRARGFTARAAGHLDQPRGRRRTGIAIGDLVEASNRFGTLRLPAHVTEDVIAGTIVMPQGAWWQAEGHSMQNTPGAANARTADAAEPIDVGGCINTLTTSRPRRWRSATPNTPAGATSTGTWGRRLICPKP